MHSGPKIEADGLVFALDATSRRSTLRPTHSTNNILLDPNLWTTGTGGFTGYNANGSSSEQNRVVVTDDPWGRTSVTWRTTPDATSGADGGWNSSYYAIDRAYTYRWSIWVRRYTTGTGGTFYLGLNPAPIRNDNGATQGNPYFHCPGISNLAYNQWYLVVGHIFYEGYTGSRHPDSGWYANGARTSELGFCNMGSQDGRWASTTTTSMLRAYHYYTTNTASGIEFAYPRLDKIDGKEPSIKEMINVGESGWNDLAGKTQVNIPTNPSNYTKTSQYGSFVFDGTNDHIQTNLYSGRNTATQPFTVEAIVKANNTNTAMMWVDVDSNGSNQRFYASLTTANRPSNFGIYNSAWSHGTCEDTNYHHQTIVMDGSTARYYDNGVQVGTKGYSAYTLPANIRIASRGASSYFWNGEIPVFKIHERALSATEVQQNFLAYKNRFNIS